MTPLAAVGRSPAPGSPADSALALARVSQALRRLRGTMSLAARFGEATKLACEIVGFERSALFTVSGHTLATQSVCLRGVPDGEPTGVQPRADSFELGPWLHESEVLRRRRAVLVEDAARDSRALTMLPSARSYVIAPVVCQSRAIALIHADRGPAGRAVTALDRDLLLAFAEGFGCALERDLLAERLRMQSERLLDLVRSPETDVTELGSLAGERPSPWQESTTGEDLSPPDAQLHRELTRRELEVLAMLAEGQTNAGIAERLVVSEGTVKTHVKHILRKLGVHNRSQAVSRYFRGLSPNRGYHLAGPFQ